jgi:hypothetical protein
MMTHTFLFTKPGYIATSYRQIQLNRDVDILTFLAPVASEKFVPETIESDSFYGFGEVGSSIKILTRPIAPTKFLLRFQNMDDVNTNTVNTTVFKNSAYGAGTVVEMSLTVNQAKADMIKSRFNWNGLQLNNPAFAKTDYLDSDTFELRPLEIRSFVVDVTPAKDVEVIDI